MLAFPVTKAHTSANELQEKQLANLEYMSRQGDGKVSGRCPVHGRGWNYMIFKVSSNTIYSMILWLQNDFEDITFLYLPK